MHWSLINNSSASLMGVKNPTFAATKANHLFFKDIPGQQDTKEFLRHLAGKDQVPHAMLFSGEAGRGTLPLVRAFVSLLFCNKPQGGESCGKCINCVKTHKLSHPDLHVSMPVIGSKKVAADFMKEWRELMIQHPFSSVTDWQNEASDDRKQLNINVKEVAEILEFASLKSYEGGQKVLIIWMAEYLAKEGNRLLKLIEEPPPGMYIFLLTENEEAILNTIHSRCQAVVVKPLHDKEITAFLMDKHAVEKAKAERVSFQADGNVNRALKFIHQQHNNWLKEFVDWLRSCFVLKPEMMTGQVAEYAKLGREEQKQFLEVGLTALESVLIAKYVGAENVRLPEKDLKPITNLADLLSLDQIFHLTQILNQSIQDIEQNINSKVLFMRQSVFIHNVMHEKLSEAR